MTWSQMEQTRKKNSDKFYCRLHEVFAVNIAWKSDCYCGWQLQKSHQIDKRLIIDTFFSTTGDENDSESSKCFNLSNRIWSWNIFTSLVPLSIPIVTFSLSRRPAATGKRSHVENLVDLRPAKKHRCVIAIDLQPFDFTFAGEFYYANVV